MITPKLATAMSPKSFIRCFSAALLLLTPGALYAPPVGGINTVTISITGITTNKTILVETPSVKIVAIQLPNQNGTRIYAPGADSIEGHVVLERTWASTNSDWAAWFQDASEGQNVAKDVTLTYTGGTSTTIVWRDSVPARYQVLPSPTTGVRERLTLLPASMDLN